MSISFFDSIIFGTGVVIGCFIGIIPIVVLASVLPGKSRKDRTLDALESVAKNVDILMKRGK